MKKHLALFFISFAAVLMGASAMQVALFPRGNRSIAPRPGDYTPALYRDIRGLFREPAPDRREKKPEPLRAGKENERLRRFFTRLAELESGKRNMVRIVHYGDSTIWGDNLTAVLKEKFQAAYGDGGRGVVGAVQTPASSLRRHVNRSDLRYFRHKVLKHKFMETGTFRMMPGSDDELGFSGESSRPVAPGAAIRLEAPEGAAPWRSVTVYLRAPRDRVAPGSVTALNVKCGEKISTKSVSLAPGLFHAVDFPVEPSRAVDINFTGSTGTLPFVDGINVETERGISYTTFVRMGIHMAWLSAIPDGQFRAGLGALRPDLLVFQFGINEAASLTMTRYPMRDLRAQMMDWMSRIKTTLPDTDILIISPPERLVSQGSGLVPMKEALDVISLQREAAGLHGAAFLDLYEMLGGPGQMQSLVRQGLAMSDYTHLSMKGGDKIGGDIFSVINGAYLKFRGSGTAAVPGVGRAADMVTPIVTGGRDYFYFLFIVFIGGMFFLSRTSPRVLFLLTASVIFYLSWERATLALLAAVTASDYLCGRYIYRSRSSGGRGTAFLVFAILFDLSILFMFKYYGFAAQSAVSLASMAGLSVTPPVLATVLPVGISFYIFRSLTYPIDIWRGDLAPIRSLSRYALFVSFFPQLLAGPISRARDFLSSADASMRLHAIRNRLYSVLASREFAGAVFLLLLGLAKKTAADHIAANLVDRVYSNPSMFSSLEVLAAVVAYGMQIYCDFSGYTDIALGSGLLLGFRLPENFNRPYASVSVTDFWRRWHITLGSWFRDYLYISLGGNRRRVYFNLLVTMLLCGLWHGASVNFVLWGLYHGIFLALERKFNHSRAVEKRGVIYFIRIFITFVIILTGWILFRAESWDNFREILTVLASMTWHVPNLGASVLGVTAALYLLHYTPVTWKNTLRRSWSRLPAAVQGACAGAFTVILYHAATADVKPFIYLQF